MRLFFDPSLLPVTTTDIDGNILFVRTKGLQNYGYPDLIIENAGEEGELLILDILDRIFSLEFNINSNWNYNGKLFCLQLREDGLAQVIFKEVDEVRIITILNPTSGEPVKYFTKGLPELFMHPDAEVDGETLHGKDMLSHIIDQVKTGTRYNEDTVITCQEFTYDIVLSSDRVGKPVLRVQLQSQQLELKNKAITKKRNKGEHLTRVK